MCLTTASTAYSTPKMTTVTFPGIYSDLRRESTSRCGCLFSLLLIQSRIALPGKVRNGVQPQPRLETFRGMALSALSRKAYGYTSFDATYPEFDCFQFRKVEMWRSYKSVMNIIIQTYAAGEITAETYRDAVTFCQSSAIIEDAYECCGVKFSTAEPCFWTGD